MYFRAVRVADATVGCLLVAPGGQAFGEVITPVTFDPDADTIRWEAGLARLNQVFDANCASCADLAIGDTLEDPYVTSQYTELNNDTGLTPVNAGTKLDSAFSTTDYNLGD